MVNGSTVARHPLDSTFRAWHLGALVNNLWQYRELTTHLVVRSLRAQYKGSFVGYGWIFANPLLQFLVYFFVFSSVLTVPSEGDAPFSLMLFVGLVPWLFFGNAVGSASESIVGSASFIKTVYFPRELLVLAAVATRLVDWIAGTIIMIALLIYNGHAIGWEILWLVPLFIVYIMFTLGICLPLAALNLFLRDIRYLVNIALMLGFFVTPVVYPLSAVPERFQWIYELNPISRFISSFRYMLLQGVAPPTLSLIVAFGISVLSLGVGYFLFKKMESGFADHI